MRLELPDLTSPDGPTAFLLGVIFNQTIRADAAWRAPQVLAERLGHLDVDQLAAEAPQILAAVITRRPAVHPFSSAMARNVIGTAQMLAADFDGRAERIWDDQPTPQVLLERLTAFPGIGQHKAEVALYWLATEYGVPLADDGTAVDTALAHCPALAAYAGQS